MRSAVNGGFGGTDENSELCPKVSKGPFADQTSYQKDLLKLQQSS